MIKLVSQGLGYLPPVTLTTNDSVMTVPGMAIIPLLQKVILNHFETLSLFQKVI